MYAYAYRYPSIAILGGGAAYKNFAAAASLDAFIARVEADGGVVLLTTELCQNFGMSEIFSFYYMLEKRVTADGGEILLPQLWNVL